MGNLWVIFVGICVCTCCRFVVGGSTNITTDTLVVNKGPPALFVFGDSLVDSGNNNYLFTAARADVPPYGIDLPNHRPAGRFSNGLNIPDILSEQIGSEPTLPFLSPMLTGQRLLLGANFASAGIGILNDTGFQFVNTINMHTQLEYFKQYQQRLKQVIGEEKANQLVNDGLVLISVGGNDFVNNYFLVPFSPRSRQFELPDYVRFLISEYRNILLNLYGLGARRVIVMGTGPLGCAPAELAQHSPNGACVTELQEAASMFNPQLADMLTDLNAQLGANVFFTANTQNMHNDIMTDPQAYGFVTSKTACCGQGPFNGMGLCTAFSNLCQNRSSYLFWDAFHPTERANRVIVQQMMSGSIDYMAPYNLNVMLALDSDHHL